jgi:hypothetical protein
MLPLRKRQVMPDACYGLRVSCRVICLTVFRQRSTVIPLGLLAGSSANYSCENKDLRREFPTSLCRNSPLLG